jgi:hypothetical protein
MATCLIMQLRLKKKKKYWPDSKYRDSSLRYYKPQSYIMANPVPFYKQENTMKQ